MKQQIIYYQKRAKEYESIYQKRERQVDLKEIKKYLTNQFRDKNIIEIACGTGYWTEHLSINTKSILGIDINNEVLEIARTKEYRKNNVRFDRQDYKRLSNKSNYGGLFGGFIWSHILKEELDRFLVILLNQLKEGSEIIFIDNKFVEGSSTPISRKDVNGNTYQIRELESLEKFEILKNFPTKNELVKLISRYGSEIEFVELEYYWIIKFQKKR